MAVDYTVEYPGRVIVGDPGYPYGRARNITSSGDGTGTPWEQRLANDIFGLFQSLLMAAGIVPSGTPDAVGASDYLDAITGLRRMDTEGIRLANTDEYDSVAMNANVAVVVAGPPESDMAVVIAGAAAEIGTSHDATTFTARTPGGGFAGSFSCGAASATAVVLAGTAAEIQQSTAPATWTHRNADASYTGAWVDAAYGAGRFVLLGEAGEIQTSDDDGVTWTRRAMVGFGASDSWKSVTYDGTRFIAIGALGGVLTDAAVAISTDGITWTLTATAPALTPTRGGALASDGARIVSAVASGGVSVSDDDGATWTPVSIESTKGVVAGVTSIRYARGIFAAVGVASSEYEVYLSLNGATWALGGRVAGNVGVASLNYAADRWIAARSAGHIVRSLRAART